MSDLPTWPTSTGLLPAFHTHWMFCLNGIQSRKCFDSSVQTSNLMTEESWTTIRQTLGACSERKPKFFSANVSAIPILSVPWSQVCFPADFSNPLAYFCWWHLLLQIQVHILISLYCVAFAPVFFFLGGLHITWISLDMSLFAFILAPLSPLQMWLQRSWKEFFLVRV